MKTKLSKTKMAASVAPEDLNCGDFVAVLAEVIEFPSFFWFDTLSSKREEPVRVRFMSSRNGVPQKIDAICLPFVHVKSPFGKCETLDVRQVQLARLKKGYAKTVWRNLRKQSPVINSSTR